MLKKADAFKEYREAAMVDMMLKSLPKVRYQSCKVVALNLLCFIFDISSWLLFLIAVSKVIALLTIAIAIVVALARY